MPARQVTNWGEAERPGAGKAGSALWAIGGIADIVGWGHPRVRRFSKHLLSRSCLIAGSAKQLLLMLLTILLMVLPLLVVLLFLGGVS